MADIKPIFNTPPETERLPTPYASVPYSPEGFGAGIGTGLQQLAQVASDIHAREVHRQSAARVMKYVGEFGEAADVLLHNPRGGVLNLEGEAALGAYDGTVKKLRDLQTKAAKDLTDENQRAAFMEHSEGVLRTAVRQLEVHTSTQGEKLKVEGLASTQRSMFGSAIRAIDQTSADEYMQKGSDATRAYWSEHANEAVAEEKVKEYVGVVNAGRLDRLLANPDTQGDAIRLFQSRHDFLPADKLDTYEAKVAAVGVAAQVDATAIAISRKALQANGQIDQRLAQGLIDVLPPGPMKDQVQHRIDHRASIFDKAWRDERDLLAGKVADQMTDPVTGEMSAARANAADMKALELKDPIRAAAMKKGAAVEGAKARYAQAYDYFFGSPAARERTATMTPDEFRTDPMVLQLRAKHKTPIVQMFDAMRKNVNKQAPPEALVMEEARNVLGLGDTKIGQLSGTKQEKMTDLFIAVQDEMRDYVIHHDGQTPDKAKIRDIIRSNLAVTASHWFSADELRFQAGAAERRRKRGGATSAATPPTTGAALVPPPPAPRAAPSGQLPGFAGWRTSKDGKTRFPADAKGARLGPDELVR